MSGKKKQTSISFLSDYFLISPQTEKRMKIKNIKNVEDGLKPHLEIEVGNKNEAWLFAVYCEEI